MRLLKANEVELRVQQIKKTQYGVYVTLLVYKDARVDMKALDETYGELNWQRHHKEINGRLYCTIAVWDANKNIWVEKEDVGTEANTEKEKSLASDSFKRSGTNWGIGRELYDAPNIRFKLNEGEYSDYNGKISTYAKFRVAEMEYDKDKGEFTKFTVVDSDGQVRFTNGKGVNTSSRTQSKPVKQEKQQVQAITQPETKNTHTEQAEPTEWVKDYKGYTCVYIPALKKWEFLVKITNGAVLAMIATDAQGKYASAKAEARQIMADIAAKKNGGGGLNVTEKQTNTTTRKADGTAGQGNLRERPAQMCRVRKVGRRWTQTASRRVQEPWRKRRGRKSSATV